MKYEEFRSQVYLLTLHSIGIQSNYFEYSLFNNIKLTPSDIYTEEILCFLVHEGFLDANPIKNKLNTNSQIESLGFHIMTNIDDFKEVKLSKEKSFYLVALWKEIANWECIEYLTYHLNELKFLFNTTERLKETYIDLLNNFSVGQLYNITYSSIESALYKLRKKEIKEEYILNYVLETVKGKANRSLELGYKYHNYKRDPKIPQSELSNYYFNKYLEIYDDGFNLVPGLDYLKIS